ncbi:MAG: hypothetical protein WAK11_12400 [Candidatus Cybelea sp.]
MARLNAFAGLVAIGTFIVAVLHAVTHSEGVPAFTSGFFLFNKKRYGALRHRAGNFFYHVLLKHLSHKLSQYPERGADLS